MSEREARDPFAANMVRGKATPPMDNPTETRQVFAELTHLEDEVGQLGKALDILTERLQPVMSDAGPTGPTGEVGGPVRVLCTIADRIRNQANKLVEFRRLMEAFTGRLQI